MIPVRLQMRNFMCYRENVPPLEFAGIHLACLSGDNGNGKSAIIDAMTWALWGKARAGSTDDLIHSLAAEMEVEFDFTVKGDLYRVIRKRTRPRKRTGAGQSSLDLFAISGETVRNISGNVIDETQRKIINTLRMDYDTFINSAYLRQGHADEFTRQPAGKRKEVLSTILDLGVYDALEDKAKALARGHEADMAQMEAAIAEMATELDRRPEYEDAFARAQETLSRVDAVAQEKEKSLIELRRRKEGLETRQAQLDELNARTAEDNRSLRSWEEQAEHYRVNILKHEQVIARRDEIEAGYAGYLAARQDSESLAAKFQQFVNLERQKTRLEAEVTQAMQGLNTELALVRKEIAALEAKAVNLPELRAALAAAQGQLTALEEQEKTLRGRDEALQEARRQVSYLEAETARLEREISEVTEKLDLIASHLESHTDARCPLCESELTREGLELIRDKYVKEQHDKTAALQAKRANLSRQGELTGELQQERDRLESGISREKAGLQGKVAMYLQEIAEIEGEESQLEELQASLAGIEDRLAGRDFATDEQQAIKALEAELAALGYDETAHHRAQEEVSRLQVWEKEKTGLDEAVKLIDQEKAGAARAEENIRALQEKLQRDIERREAFVAELAQLPALREAVAAAEAAYRDLSAQRSRAQETVGSVRERLQRLDELAEKKQAREKNLAAVSREAAVYRDLTKAFGKAGIQALLIETALPDIASEANRLLTRMTDNRMHVNFEMQRPTKQQGVYRETLDISITDELGTRAYEMFSGGEAFRIDFAIRIALSRLLARRAGAPLPTLIIDEGFGTQDSTGLDKLKEAINSIQDDFDKIIVITHMDELKDAFPTRIDVVKTGDGSSITVN